MLKYINDILVNFVLIVTCDTLMWKISFLTLRGWWPERTIFPSVKEMLVGVSLNG